MKNNIENNENKGQNRTLIGLKVSYFANVSGYPGVLEQNLNRIERMGGVESLSMNLVRIEP